MADSCRATKNWEWRDLTGLRNRTTLRDRLPLPRWNADAPPWSITEWLSFAIKRGLIQLHESVTFVKQSTSGHIIPGRGLVGIFVDVKAASSIGQRLKTPLTMNCIYNIRSTMKTTESIIKEITGNCLLTSTRRISRIVTGIFDQKLRPLEINSPQFSLLVVIARLGAANRAAIGRANHQDRSTLTRNLQLLLAAGWVQEIHPETGERGRPLVLTETGAALLHNAVPAWRAAQKKAEQILGKAEVIAVKTIAAALSRQTE